MTHDTLCWKHLVWATALGCAIAAATPVLAAQSFDDRVAFDAAVAAQNGVVQFEDWDGLSSSFGTVGIGVFPVPPWPAYITGSAIDTGYAIDTTAASMAWIQNAGDIGGVQASRAFGSNNSTAGAYLVVDLDDANVIGVDVHGTQTTSATLTIRVFDQSDQPIDTFTRNVVPSTSVFFGYIGDVPVGSVQFEIEQESQHPIEYVDDMTFGNADVAVPAVPAVGPVGLGATGLLLAAFARIRRRRS